MFLANGDVDVEFRLAGLVLSFLSMGLTTTSEGFEFKILFLSKNSSRYAALTAVPTTCFPVDAIVLFSWTFVEGGVEHGPFRDSWRHLALYISAFGFDGCF